MAPRRQLPFTETGVADKGVIPRRPEPSRERTRHRQGDVPMAVKAMKAGAADFIEKPIRRDELFASIEHALEHTRDSAKLSVGGRFFKNHLS
jgi:hypothetical protein